MFVLTCITLSNRAYLRLMAGDSSIVLEWKFLFWITLAGGFWANGFLGRRPCKLRLQLVGAFSIGFII